MLSREEIKKWLLENCVDSAGDLRLMDLDFSDFDGNIFIGGMKVKKDLYQSGQEVEGNLFQNGQEVEGNIYQNLQKVVGSLYQNRQKVGENLFQCNQTVEGSIYQNYQKVVGNIFQDEIECSSKSQAEVDELQTVEIDKLKTETNELIKENQELKEKLEGYETLLLHLAKELKEGGQNDK